MMNKKNLWFLTLFSLVLVLSIYYVTMPSDLLAASTSSTNNTSLTDEDVEVEPSSLGETIVEQDDNNIVIKNGIIIFFISIIINYFYIKVHVNKTISKIKL